MHASLSPRSFVVSVALAALAMSLPAIAAPAQDPAYSIHELHVPVATAGVPYETTLHIDDAPPGAGFTWERNGPLPSGIAFIPDDDRAMLAGTTSTIGEFAFTVTATDENGAQFVRPFRLFVNDPASAPLAFEQDELDAAQVGVHYLQTVRVTQPAVAWANYEVALLAGALPPGLLWRHVATCPMGTLHGAPLAGADLASPHRFVLKASSTFGGVQLREFQLRVVPGGSAAPLRIATLALFPAQIDAAYSHDLDIAGGSPTAMPTWSVVSGSLPSGLALVQASGATPARIAGTPQPQLPGVRALTLAVTDGAETVQRSFRLHVNAQAPPFAVGPESLPYVEESGPCPTEIVMEPMTHHTAFRLEGGVLPPGLGTRWTVTGSTKLIFPGEPAVGASAHSPYTFVVSVVEPSGAAVFRRYVLEVLPEGVVVIDQGSTLSIHVDEDSPLAGPFNHFALSARDDGAAAKSLSWSIRSMPLRGEAQVWLGSPSSSTEPVTIAYEPDAGFSGADAFEVEVDDGQGHQDSIAITVEVSGTANTWHWGRLNGGQPIGERYPMSVSYGHAPYSLPILQHGAGGWNGSSTGLVYAVSSRNLGMCLGRLTDAGVWQLRGPNGWTSDPSVVPETVDTALEHYGRVDFVPHPDFAGGWLGIARGVLGIGKQATDTHGHLTHIRHDGTRWRRWSTGGAWSDLRPEPIFRGIWKGAGTGSCSFSFDPVHREGLVVGEVGAAGTMLSASRMDLDDAGTRFQRWSQVGGLNGHWSSSSHVDWPDSVILDSRADPILWSMHSLALAHVEGTRDHVVAFTLASRLSLARYRGAKEVWEWWDGAEWQPGDGHTTSYAAQIADVLALGTATPDGTLAFALPDGVIGVLSRAGGQIYEVTYDGATGAVSAPTSVTPVLAGSDGPHFAVGVAADGTALLAYRRDALRLEVRTRALDGTWSAPTLAYATESRLHVLAVGWSTEQPVVFCKHIEAPVEPDGFVYALGDTPSVHWAHETPLVLDPIAQPGLLSPSEATFETRVSQRVPDGQNGATLSVSVGVDDDGYVYAGNLFEGSVTVQPPGADPSGDDNHAWGADWDHLIFPGGIAVWPEMQRVFIGNWLSSDGAGGPAAHGQISVWDSAEMRDHSVGYRLAPPGWITDWSPQVFFSPSAPLWCPAGVAIDRASGILYVTSSLESQIHVFDALHTQDSSAAFPIGELLYDVAPAHVAYVQALLTELETAGLIELVPPASMRWVAAAWSEVLEPVTASASYAQLAEAERVSLRRNLMRMFKALRDVPVHLYTYDQPGSGAAQLLAPVALAVDGAGDLWVLDSGNSRVQRFTPDHANATFLHRLTVGSRGRAPGQLLHPASMSVSSDGRVFVSDPLNDRVSVFTTAGAFVSDFDRYVREGSERRIVSPLGVWAGRDGFLYLSSTEDHATAVTTFSR